MTGEVWRSAVDPVPMLRYLIGSAALRVQSVEAFPDSRGSDRKLRLFACACYQRLEHLLPHPVARATVSVAERFADGAAGVVEFRRAEATVRALADALEPRWRASTGAERIALHPTHAALSLALVVCWAEARKAAYYASSNAYLEAPYLANPGIDVHDPRLYQAEVAEKRSQCELLREIFGDPYRAVAFSQDWRTDTVLSLAGGVYDSGNFSALPVLGDALEDAGCDSAEILGRCRAGGPHARGWWVLDLVLGKE